MKKIIINVLVNSFFICLIILGVLYHDKVEYYYFKYLDFHRKNITIENNKYAKKEMIEGIKLTDNFTAQNKTHLLNIYYTIINSGVKNFTFYCSVDYEECLNDISALSKENDELSVINDVVNPYNSFSSIITSYTETGQVSIEIEKLYTGAEINQIDYVVNNIINTKLNSSMKDREKIEIIHDYLINTSRYDTKNESPKNGSAYGLLIDHLGTCNGYSDAFGIIMNALGIENYKISNSKHVWNYVKIDNKWYHIDLTWDDPVTNNGSNLLLHNFFLITTDELLNLDKTNHGFNPDYYLEIK